MPYLKNYIDLIDVEYDVINWDRLSIEDIKEFTYRDNKIGHQRNLLDYYKYYRFIIQILKGGNYDKVIVFGIQLTFFLQNVLINHFKGNYVIDIRDHHKLINLMNWNTIKKYGRGIVVSSPGFLEWLPKGEKYYINHNTTIESLKDLHPIVLNKNTDKKIRIANIGSFRDYKINIEFINSLKNSKTVILNYHGRGGYEESLRNLKDEKNILNLNITGEYTKDIEESLYLKNDLINVLRHNDGINNYTALPNRLYNSLVFGKPLISYQGTYLSEIINKYNLGLVINDFDLLEAQIVTYIYEFDDELFVKGRKLFFKKVIKDNKLFHEMISEFTNLNGN